MNLQPVIDDYSVRMVRDSTGWRYARWGLVIKWCEGLEGSWSLTFYRPRRPS